MWIEVQLSKLTPIPKLPDLTVQYSKAKFGGFFPPRNNIKEGTVKSGNFGIGKNFDNCTSIHIIPPGYFIIWFSEKC